MEPRTSTRSFLTIKRGTSTGMFEIIPAALQPGASFSSASSTLLLCLKPSRRLLLYGSYCSQVETATKHLDKLSSQREDIRMKLEVWGLKQALK